MGKITVTAAEGVRVKVHIQKLEELSQKIPEVRDSAGGIVAPAETRKHMVFATKSIVGFASEKREFEVGKGQRLIVEEQ